MTRRSFIIILLSFFVVISLISGFICYKQKSLELPVHTENLILEDLDSSVQIHNIDVPFNLDTVPFKATVVLNEKKNKHVLFLPNAGTETNIIIGDSLYPLNWDKSPKIYLTADFYSNEKVVVDITDLKKGKYTVHYLGCYTGGLFSLKIE